MRAPLHPRDLIAVAVVAVLALAGSGSHVVRSGETLAGIAYSHGTTVSALVDANGIANPDLIRIGQELTIPAGSSSGGSAASTTYTVEPGDTLAEIAIKFGTTVSQLASANGIANPNLIRIGQQLAVAGGAGGGTTASGGGAPAGSSGQYHYVKPGDTIAGIAAQHGISSDQLIAWNGLVDGKLYSTVRLHLFNPGALPAAGSGGGSHVVKPGETLGLIASRLGASASQIASASGIRNPNLIRIGQELTIPGGTGGFQCPVAGAVFFNDWGFPRSGGRAHSGNDIFAPRGTPVTAPASGQVDTVVGSIGGNQFRLTAGDGTIYIGSHMDDFGKTGAVSAGEVIGYVGDTGNARGSSPHLHFEVHVGSNAVNPYPLIRSTC